MLTLRIQSATSMKKTRQILVSTTIIGMTLLFSSCFKKGEDDPFFSFHSRDARLAQNWMMESMQGTVVNTIDGLTITTYYDFDGTNIFINTDGATESYGYAYAIKVKDNGEVSSTETRTDPANANDVLQTSTKNSYWFWSNDAQNKTTVNMDLTGLLEPYLSYDIPRLAWSDMTWTVNFSDNYQQNEDTVTISTSTSVNFTINWVYDNGRN